MLFAKEKSAHTDQETKYLLDYIRQWEKQNPGEEMVFLTLPKYDREERKRILEAAVKILNEEKFPGAKNCEREEQKSPITPEEKILPNR